MSEGLYPKLLEGGHHNFLQDNLLKLFYFAFPLVGLSIVFAKPGLYALNPIYSDGSMVVIFIAMRILLRDINQKFTQALQGTEEVDMNNDASQKDYLKSKLFHIPTINLIEKGVYLGSLSLILLLMRDFNSQLELVIIWSIIGVLSQIPFTIYFGILVKKNFPFKPDLQSVGKYVMIGIVVFVGVHFLAEEFLIYTERIFEFFPQLIIFGLIGIIPYLGLTFALDSKTRTLFKSIINELKRK